MAIAKELLDSFSSKELAAECERVSIYVKIIVSAWDGLSDEEAASLSVPSGMVLLSDAEAKAVFEENLVAIHRGELVEDMLLQKVKDFMMKVPDAHRALIGKALFQEACSVLVTDNILSKQEREVMEQEIAPLLLVPTDEVKEALDKAEADLKSAAEAKASSEAAAANAAGADGASGDGKAEEAK